MEDSLTGIVREMRSDGAVLRKHGDARIAATLDTFAERLERSEELWLLEWLSEADAMRASGHAQRWFRERRAAWSADALAQRTPRGWQYRRCIVPGAWSRERAA